MGLSVGTLLVVVVAAAMCDPQLVLPFLAVGVLVVVPAGLVVSRRIRDHKTVLHLDQHGITVDRASYAWRDIDSVAVRQTHKAAPAMLVIEGHRRPGIGTHGVQVIDLSHYGIPAEPVRRALARFAGPRLVE